jgi:hypothetical protein
MVASFVVSLVGHGYPDPKGASTLHGRKNLGTHSAKVITLLVVGELIVFVECHSSTLGVRELVPYPASKSKAVYLLSCD